MVDEPYAVMSIVVSMYLSKVELALQFLPIIPDLPLNIVLSYPLRVVVLDLVYGHILQTNRRILIQSANHLGGCDPVCHYFFTASSELAVYVNWYEQRPENTEEDEEVVHAQSAPLNLRHHWVSPVIGQFLSSEDLALLDHFQVLLAGGFSSLLQHVLSDTHLQIQQTDAVCPAFVHRRVYVLVNQVVRFGDAHTADTGELVISDATAQLLLDHAILFEWGEGGEGFVGGLLWDGRVVFLHRLSDYNCDMVGDSINDGSSCWISTPLSSILSPSIL